MPSSVNFGIRFCIASALLAGMMGLSLQAKADDYCPTVTLVGNPGACHVTPADPGEQNGSVVSYTVTGTAHGNHDDGSLRKITNVSLYSLKTVTPPPNPPTDMTGWTLKWTQTANPYLAQFAYTWNAMYYGAGNFWWDGTTQDDYTEGNGIRALYSSTTVGPYYTHN